MVMIIIKEPDDERRYNKLKFKIPQKMYKLLLNRQKIMNTINITKTFNRIIRKSDDILVYKDHWLN